MVLFIPISTPSLSFFLTGRVLQEFSYPFLPATVVTDLADSRSKIL